MKTNEKLMIARHTRNLITDTLRPFIRSFGEIPLPTFPLLIWFYNILRT